MAKVRLGTARIQASEGSAIRSSCRSNRRWHQGWTAVVSGVSVAVSSGQGHGFGRILSSRCHHYLGQAVGLGIADVDGDDRQREEEPKGKPRADETC
jgi:hypothetical protein